MSVSEDFRVFLTNFYTDALASVLISWIRDKDHSNKEKMVQYISMTLYGTIKQVLEKAETKLAQIPKIGKAQGHRFNLTDGLVLCPLIFHI